MPLVTAVVLVTVFSVVATLRYAVDQLNSDGIISSVVSLQRGSFFGWGAEGRTTPVSYLVSPLGDPDLNLAAVLTLSAVGFHLLLLACAVGITRALTHEASWSAVLVTFLLSVAAFHLGLTPVARYGMLLENQSFGWAWASVVTSALVWKGGSGRRRSVAVVLVLLAVAIDPTTAVFPPAVGLVVLASRPGPERRSWLAYSASGPVLAVLWWLVSSWGRGRAVAVDWDVTGVSTGWASAGLNIFQAFRPTRLTLAVAVAALAAVMLSARTRARLATLLGGITLLAVAYLMSVTGRPVVSESGDPVRFFYPVVVLAGLLLVVPVASLLFGLVDRDQLTHVVRPFVRPGPGRLRWAPLTVASLAAALAMIGPLHRPWNAEAFVATRGTLGEASSEGVGFVSGDYWSVWPVVHQLLDSGRDSAFGVVSEVDQSPTGAGRLMAAQVAARGRATAFCLDAPVADCASALGRSTGGTWADSGVACMATATVSRNALSERSCRVLWGR